MFISSGGMYKVTCTLFFFFFFFLFPLWLGLLLRYTLIQGGGVMPMVESDPVKDTNGPRYTTTNSSYVSHPSYDSYLIPICSTVELAVQSANLPFTFIRPQYIYGPKSSKRYLDFFIGRAARKLPIPLPLSGQQLVSLSHIEDVCSLIGAAVGHPSATNQVKKDLLSNINSSLFSSRSPFSYSFY